VDRYQRWGKELNEFAAREQRRETHLENGFYATRQRKAEANGASYEPILTATTKNLGDSAESLLPEVPSPGRWMR
jgi:hypothetical protein